jgi:hypothetical protein
MRCAVHLDDDLRRAPGGLMQAVDVLGDDRQGHAASLEVDEGTMAGGGDGGPDRRVEPGAPGASPDLGIVKVVGEGRQLLGGRVARPEAVWPPEVGKAGAGRDAGAGEDHDSPCRGELVARFSDDVLVHASPSFSPCSSNGTGRLNA